MDRRQTETMAENSAAAFLESQGLTVTTPDVAAFRTQVQEKFLASDFAKSWPEGMLDRINATTEQRAQIKQITAAAQVDMKAQHESGKALRQEFVALFSQPTVDARAAEELRQKQMLQRDAASKRMLQMMLDVSAVLSADQRKQIADSMAQRREMMQRHQRERRGIDTPKSGG